MMRILTSQTLCCYYGCHFPNMSIIWRHTHTHTEPHWVVIIEWTVSENERSYDWNINIYIQASNYNPTIPIISKEWICICHIQMKWTIHPHSVNIFFRELSSQRIDCIQTCTNIHCKEYVVACTSLHGSNTGFRYQFWWELRMMMVMVMMTMKASSLVFTKKKWMPFFPHR